MKRIGRALVGAAVVAAVGGCGGAMPTINPMTNSLTEGINAPPRTQSAKARQIVERSPWDVAALRRAAPKAKYSAERAETVDKQALTLRDVTFQTEPTSGASLTLSATLVTPARAAGDRRLLPALVLIPDRGDKAPLDAARTWATRGYAALALSLPTKDASSEKSSGPEWSDEALVSTSPATNPIHASVAGVIAAVNLLAAQPSIDARRIGLAGEGWGGVIAALAGAVDDRPRALVLVRTAGGLNRGPVAEALKKLPAKEREAWIKAYDPDSYAKADHPATLFVQPLAAAEPPLAAVLTTFRGQTGAKTLALIPPDAKDGETATETAWLASRLLDQPALPEVRSLHPDGDAAVVQVSGKQPPRAVTVYYATGDLAKADWKSVEGEKQDDRDWRCTLPKPEDGRPLTVFAALTDAAGAIVCSDPGPLTAAAATPRGRAIAARASR